MICQILLLFIGLLLALSYGPRFLINRYAATIPTIQPFYPIVGHALIFFGKSTKQTFWILVQYFDQINRLGKLMFGSIPFICVNHPDLLQQVLTRSDLHNKPFPYNVGLGGWLNQGLIFERSGEKWYRSRKALNPSFNTRMLTSYLPIMDERARELVTELRTVADGCTEINILKYISKCTIEIVLGTTMHRNVGEDSAQKEFLKHQQLIMNRIGEEMMNASKCLKLFNRMTQAHKSIQGYKDSCLKYVDKIINDRRLEIQNEGSAMINNDEFRTKSLNFLDQCLTSTKDDGTGFTHHEISDHIISLLAAGNDTTALAVAYTCLFLAMYPEIQAKVQAELDEVFYSSTIEVTPDSLKKLLYTEMVLKEVLRLCPSVPIFARKTGNEIYLDGVRIPKGQMIAINVYSLHHRKDIWGATPERFDPERFRPEAIEGRHTYAFLPFSGGLRNCIGARYAMNSMKVILLRVLQKFDIKTNLKQANLRFKFEIALKLEGPHSVSLTNRNTC